MATRKRKKAPRTENGRPTTLTPAMEKRFVRYVKHNYFETAAAMCALHPRTARRWMKRGADELDRLDDGKAPKPGEAIFAKFATGVRKAEADGEGEQVERLVKHGETDPSSVIRYLERKYPKKWGNRLQVTQELAGQIDAVFAKLEKHLSPEEYARVLEILDEADS